MKHFPITRKLTYKRCGLRFSLNPLQIVNDRETISGEPEGSGSKNTHSYRRRVHTLTTEHPINCAINVLFSSNGHVSDQIQR